jgi:hypothetical protein
MAISIKLPYLPAYFGMEIEPLVSLERLASFGMPGVFELL